MLPHVPQEGECPHVVALVRILQLYYYVRRDPIRNRRSHSEEVGQHCGKVGRGPSYRWGRARLGVAFRAFLGQHLAPQYST